jgi:hypothetical protein
VDTVLHHAPSEQNAIGKRHALVSFTVVEVCPFHGTRVKLLLARGSTKEVYDAVQARPTRAMRFCIRFFDAYPPFHCALFSIPAELAMHVLISDVIRPTVRANDR